MHLIQLFYASTSDACRQTREMLEELVERREDVLLVTYDVDTDAVREMAHHYEVTTVPTTIVDGKRVIRGVPHSTEQVLDEG